MPEHLTTDNTPVFRSNMFTEFLQRNGITHHHLSDHHPQSDLAEIGIKLFKSTLRHAQSDAPTGRDWVQLIRRAIAAIINTQSETITFTPFELLYGVDANRLYENQNIPEEEPIETEENWLICAHEQAQAIQQYGNVGNNGRYDNGTVYPNGCGSEMGRAVLAGNPERAVLLPELTPVPYLEQLLENIPANDPGHYQVLPDYVHMAPANDGNEEEWPSNESTRVVS
ncbi:hypothetical protein H4S08_004786 [Coemansia sp. RSA 1365]|nr:hypothetical protein H4S08_004786 [Coemansia sp. RSA 1365]